MGIVEDPFNGLYLYAFMNVGDLQVQTVKIPVSRFDIAVCFTVRVTKHEIKLVGYVAG